MMAMGDPRPHSRFSFFKEFIEAVVSVIMATCTLAGLEEVLREIGLVTPIPKFSGARVLLQPIDIWRSYLADTTSKLLGCNAETAFEGAVHSSNSKDNGDLVLVLPKLMLKANANTKAKDLAAESISNVRHCNLSVAQSHRGLTDLSAVVYENPIVSPTGTGWSASAILPLPDDVTADLDPLYQRSMSGVWCRHSLGTQE